MSTKYMGENALAKLCGIIKSAAEAIQNSIPTKLSDLTNDKEFEITFEIFNIYETNEVTINKTCEEILVAIIEGKKPVISGSVCTGDSVYIHFDHVPMSGWTSQQQGTLYWQWFEFKAHCVEPTIGNIFEYHIVPFKYHNSAEAGDSTEFTRIYQQDTGIAVDM